MRWSMVLLLLLALTAQAGEGLKQAEGFLEEMEYRKALSLADRLLSTGGRGPDELVQIYQLNFLNVIRDNVGRMARPQDGCP